MAGGLFDDPAIDVGLTRGPADVGEAPSGVQWRDVDVPRRGCTPAAKNASATGAMAAAPKAATRAKGLMWWFLEKKRLTIAEAATLMNEQEKCVTGPWNRLEHKLGWIRGTGQYFTYRNAAGRPIRREYHELTDEGRKVALEMRDGGGR